MQADLSKLTSTLSTTIRFLVMSYFIVARCTFTINFSSKLKSQLFQIISGHDTFPLKMSPFQVSLLQRFTNCLLTNVWWNTRIRAFTITLFLQKSFPSLLASAWFVVRYFSFVKQTVLLVFPDYSFVTTKSPIFFSICLQMVAFEYLPV